MSERFEVIVDDEGRLVPLYTDRTRRLSGKRRWVSLHASPAPGLRSNQGNKYLWGVCYATIAHETGNDPESIHYGLKREAVDRGILDPQYILLGDKLVEADPTTRTDAETFSRYVDWVRHYALHDLGGIVIPEAGE